MGTPVGLTGQTAHVVGPSAAGRGASQRYPIAKPHSAMNVNKKAGRAPRHWRKPPLHTKTGHVQWFGP